MSCHPAQPCAFYLTGVIWVQPSSFGVHSPPGAGLYRDCSTEETQKRRTLQEVLPFREELAGVRWLLGLSDTPQAKVSPEQKQGTVDPHCPSDLGEHS